MSGFFVGAYLMIAICVSTLWNVVEARIQCANHDPVANSILALFWPITLPISAGILQSACMMDPAK